MAIVSVSIPDELKRKMEKIEDINWSAVAKKAFEDKLSDSDAFIRFKQIVSKSKLTEKDAKNLAEKINRGVTTQAWKIYEANNRR